MGICVSVFQERFNMLMKSLFDSHKAAGFIKLPTEMTMGLGLRIQM